MTLRIIPVLRRYHLTSSSNHAERTHATAEGLPSPLLTPYLDRNNGNLNLGRIAVLRDLGRISSVPLEYVKSAALPPLLQQIDVTEIKESLQLDGTIWSNDSR